MQLARSANPEITAADQSPRGGTSTPPPPWSSYGHVISDVSGDVTAAPGGGAAHYYYVNRFPSRIFRVVA